MGCSLFCSYEDGSTAGAKAGASTRGGAKKKAASPKVAGSRQGKRTLMSAKTRAKIAAAARARHGKVQAG